LTSEIRADEDGKFLFEVPSLKQGACSGIRVIMVFAQGDLDLVHRFLALIKTLLLFEDFRSSNSGSLFR